MRRLVGVPTPLAAPGVSITMDASLPFCRKMHKYDCEEVRQLVITCLIELELKLLPKDLAKVIERFVQ